jgi:ABC-type branched-subunit amino acid transport system ATPase component
VLNGLVKPNAGSVKVQGDEMVRLRPSAICAKGIGRTFQVVRPFPRMSLLENVVVGAFVNTATDAEAIVAAREAIARTGLAHLEQMPVSELTNFELRLMELARACSAKPKLLLLDEPFAGLAANEVDAFIDLLRELRASGLTVAIIEHTMQAMMKLADRFVVLDHGQVIAEGDPRVVVKDRKVVKAYLGDKWMADAEA